jgi:signal transduction histidine kinase
MNIFRQLRWKLTLSYTIVTVCAFLVVILILIGIILPRIFVPENIVTPEGIITALMEESVPLWRHILSQTPVDTRLMRYLLEDTNGTITSDDILTIGSIRLFVRTTAALRALVIGADGTLLGKSDQIEIPNLMVGQSFDPSYYQGLELPFNAAMAGETDMKQLYTVFEPNKRFLLALPVFDETTGNENRIAGVIVVILESLPTQADIPVHTLNIAGRSLLILLIGAGMMGAIFGAFFANGLSKRFQSIFSTIDAWSAGDFSKFIIDTVGDEISEFSQRLNNMAKQLQELLRRRQEMAVSEERNRLARELHDSAKQQALAASFQLGTALTLFESNPQKAKTHLVEADGLVDEVRNELTNLVHELRPHTIEGQDFSEILKEYIFDWSQRSGIEANFYIEGEDKSSVETREALFRIAQEALANISRHSSASSVEVSLVFDINAARMTIKDNGCGFDTSSHYEGLGLSSMKERAEGLSGSFTINSGADKGTEIIIILPV